MRDVLIIDDDPYFRDILSRLLEGRFNVDSVGDGASGLGRCAPRPPDLVLLDLQLPGLGGAAVVERLWEDPRTAGVPVVAFSAGRVEAARRGFLMARGVRRVMDKLSPCREFLAAALEAAG